MFHCCINLRSIKSPLLLRGLDIVAANNLCRVMDDGTLVLPWNFSPTFS